MTDWLSKALQRNVVIRGIRVGLLVGAILTLINYGDLLVEGVIRPDMAWKIPLTFLVPYCVSTYASVASMSGRGQPPHLERGDTEAGEDT